MLIPKRNKKGLVGTATSVIGGIGVLIIAVVVILIVINLLTESDILQSIDGSTQINNETLTAFNTTSQNFGNHTEAGATCTGVVVTNSTGGETVPANNYTVTAAGCSIVYISGNYLNEIVNISSTTAHKINSTYQDSVGFMRGNFTGGIDNVSTRLVTILVIIATIILLGALVLLVRNSNLANLGGGSSL